MSNGYAANKPIYMNFDSVDVFKSNSIPFASWLMGFDISAVITRLKSDDNHLLTCFVWLLARVLVSNGIIVYVLIHRELGVGNKTPSHMKANSTVAKCTFVLVRDLRERIPERIPLAEKLHFTLKMRALRACFLRIERREDAHNGNQIPVRYV
uniref:Uncharacterized protein n=1 Tax=Glossina austeni TaxID=7395 RepID=A0A1A9VY84_GLOAU